MPLCFSNVLSLTQWSSVNQMGNSATMLFVRTGRHTPIAVPNLHSSRRMV